jgi:hypothetical protein
MTTTGPVNKIVWLKTHWNLGMNPFPPEAIARLGGEDMRENGLLFNPDVQPDKVREAVDKFVLGSIYSGLKFGYLWSVGTGVSGDARGFGKSSLMQFLVEEVNQDFGRRFVISSGLSEADAEKDPLCAVLASFDMANARSLNAVFYEAARYACRFRKNANERTLAERLHQRFAENLGTTETTLLHETVESVQRNLRGRTLGPLVSEFLHLLCDGNSDALQTYVDGITETKRTRSGAMYLATFLTFVKAAGINHVLLCCDQLEDFAATTTTRQKRTIETERFRDYILELQPMSDMLSCIVTMHPRATQAIGDMWRLADLPNYDHDRGENQQRVVVLRALESTDEAKALLRSYLEPFRTEPAPDAMPLFPFTEDTIDVLFEYSDGRPKPRDLLRRAWTLIEQGAQNNLDVIDAANTRRILEAFSQPDDADDFLVPPRSQPAEREVWS